MSEPIYVGGIIIVCGIAAILIVRWIVKWCEYHQVADWGHAWLNRLDGFNRWFCRNFHGLQAEAVPLPVDGGAIVVSNHISGLDPLLLVASCHRPLRFVIAEEQYNRWWLRWLFESVGAIPVNRSSRPEKAFYAARKALDEGEIVAIFPEGGIPDADKPKVRLKRGATILASLAQVPIFPLRLEGIRGKRLHLTAVLVPSKARVSAASPLACDNETAKDCLHTITGFITEHIAEKQ